MQNFSLKLFTAMLVGAACAWGCASVHGTQGESSVGVVNYDQYALKTPSGGADTVYSVVTSQAAFDAMFTLSGDAQKARPGFSGQTVVAIAMPAASRLQITKAAYTGSVLHVYANTCSGDSANCPRNGLALATTPKVGGIKQVKFFVNGSDKKTVALTY